MEARRTRNSTWGLWALSLALSACGGGGSGGGGGGGSLLNPGGSTGNVYVAGVYMPSSQFKGVCAAPRAGNPNDRLGTTLDEDLWLRSWTNELYLWYSEVPDINPAPYTAATYFPLLKTSAKTPSGADKDKFHFTEDTAQYNSFAQSGVQAGYGLDVELLAALPPRQNFVGYTEPNSPAFNANIQRGAQIVTIDGADFTNGSATVLNAGLFPANSGEAHTFVVLDPGAAVTRTIVLTSVNVVETPVLIVKTVNSSGGPVGYILFNDHIATSESELIAAVNTLKAANVIDLVLDIRYNGGGFLDIASELAYMIAGVNTSGHFFEQTQFNSKYPTVDPVTGQALTPTPFHTVSQGFSGASNVALPTLNLSTVYVLTGSDTCSASESVINGLRGAGVTVVQIGSTTCGKPYGFYPQDNCGTTYFSIEFKGINDAGFGDYSDGFSPMNTTAALKGVLLPGCSVADDFVHALGDPMEARLAAALAYRGAGAAACPTPSGLAPDRVKIQSVQNANPSDAIISKSPLRENRWYRRQ
jgi:carboxyl-terminal processing protease